VIITEIVGILNDFDYFLSTTSSSSNSLKSLGILLVNIIVQYFIENSFYFGFIKFDLFDFSIFWFVEFVVVSVHE